MFGVGVISQTDVDLAQGHEMCLNWLWFCGGPLGGARFEAPLLM